MTDEQTLPDLRKEIIESLMRNTDTKPDELVKFAAEILNFINGVPAPEPHLGDGLDWVKSRLTAVSVEAKFQIDALATRIKVMSDHAANDTELIASLTKRIEAMEARRAKDGVDSVVTDERVVRLARRVTALEVQRAASGFGHPPTSIEAAMDRTPEQAAVLDDIDRRAGVGNYRKTAMADTLASDLSLHVEPIISEATGGNSLERPEILDAH